MIESLERRRLLADGFAVDSSYGTNGRTTVGVSAEASDYVTRLLTTPAGKLLVLGDSGDAAVVNHLTQFNVDGTLDTSFGNGGRKILSEFGSSGQVDAVVESSGAITVLKSGSGLGVKRYLSNGTLDSTFVAPTTSSGSARHISLGTAGSYFVIFGNTVAHLTPSGAYDPGFDGDGQLVIAQEAGSVQFIPYVVQSLPDGSILVGGTYGSVSAGVKRAAFRHYFGSGVFDGSFGTLQVPAPLSNSSTPGKLILQPDGKIVAVVGDLSGGAQGYVLRINAPTSGSAGSFDTGFGAGFVFTPNFSSAYSETIGDLDLDSTGKLVGTALGFPSSGLTSETVLFRLTTGGTLDTTFGNVGSGYQRHVYDGSSAAIDWGPREIVINTSNSRLYTATAIKGITAAVQDQYLERFQLAGAADTSFGTNGQVRTSVDTAQLLTTSAVKDLGGGTIAFTANITPNNGLAVVGKVNADGTPASFGTGGAATVNFGGRSAFLNDVAAGPNGTILAAGGVSFFTTTYNDDFALVRFNSAGALDTTFGTGGKVTTSFGGDFERFFRVFVASDGSIYGAGIFQTAGVSTGAIVHYTSTGQLDTGFGNGGILKLNALFSDGAQVTINFLQVTNGKLLIAGTHNSSGNNYDSFIAQLTATGAPDPLFGAAGIVRYHSADADGYPGLAKLVVDTLNERFYTVDLSEDANYLDHAYVRRFSMSGQVDATWGTAGVATVALYDRDVINDLDLLSDGRIRLTGTRTVSTSSTATNNKDFLFIGLTASGTVDTDFGIDGFQTIDQTKYDSGVALLPLANGKYLVAGDVSLTGGDGSFASVRLNGGADVVPPKIASATADFQTRRAVVVDFSESVLASLTKSDVTLYRTSDYTTYVVNPTDWAYDAADVGGVTRLTITLAATLPDADYSVYIPSGAIADAAGNGTTASLTSGKVFFLAGDANRDRKVDFADLLVLAQNFGKLGQTFSQGNFNYSTNGAVDFSDLLILAQQFNKTLSAALSTTAIVGQPAVNQKRGGGIDLIPELQ